MLVPLSRTSKPPVGKPLVFTLITLSPISTTVLFTVVVVPATVKSPPTVTLPVVVRVAV